MVLSNGIQGQFLPPTSMGRVEHRDGVGIEQVEQVERVE